LPAVMRTTKPGSRLQTVLIRGATSLTKPDRKLCRRIAISLFR
jgi:hypothetical protein